MWCSCVWSSSFSTHFPAHCPRLEYEPMHPSLYPASSPAGRSSGTYSGWSWLLPPVFLWAGKQTFKHLNGERQLEEKKNKNKPEQAHDSSYQSQAIFSLLQHIQYNVLQLMLHWQLSGWGEIPGTSHHSLHTLLEGVSVCGCGSSNSKCHRPTPTFLSAPLQPPTLKHTERLPVCTCKVCQAQFLKAMLPVLHVVDHHSQGVLVLVQCGAPDDA